MIGRTISHYKILEKLGAGGMGVVYKAEDLKLQRLVALKFLAHHSLKDEEAKARFLREARAAAALQHPNICTVHEVDEAEGQTFIAMAYLEGRELTEEISDGPIDTGRVIDIAIQLAEGLREAHDKGTVHRDIKPANVMLTKSGQAVLMDFGLAQLASAGSRLTRDGTTVRTSAYMSPEQMSGEKVDHRTDIWALGVVLYEMAAGRLPFRGEYEQAIQYAIVHEQPEPLSDFAPGVSKEFERVVAKALAKKPVERYQHIEELLADLQALRTDSVPAKKPPGKGEWSTKTHLFGMPLVHIARGYDPETGRPRIACGIVAIGDVAVGGIAIGGISLGGIAVGGISVGLASAGGIALALWLALGAVSVGMQPYGVVAIGPQGTRVIEQASTARLQTEMPSVAVMPFINSSGDADFEYFSDGMTDELINALGKIRRLRVVGRSSVFQFKRERYNAQEVGDRLQVGALLEGTVRKAGDRLRITAQLINAADGFELWSDRFDSEHPADLHRAFLALGFSLPRPAFIFYQEINGLSLSWTSTMDNGPEADFSLLSLEDLFAGFDPDGLAWVRRRSWDYDLAAWAAELEGGQDHLDAVRDCRILYREERSNVLIRFQKNDAAELFLLVDYDLYKLNLNFEKFILRLLEFRGAKYWPYLFADADPYKELGLPIDYLAKLKALFPDIGVEDYKSN